MIPSSEMEGDASVVTHSHASELRLEQLQGRLERFLRNKNAVGDFGGKPSWQWKIHGNPCKMEDVEVLISSCFF